MPHASSRRDEPRRSPVHRRDGEAGLAGARYRLRRWHASRILADKRDVDGRGIELSQAGTVAWRKGYR
ncbi:MAG: hypothetical protein R3D30_00980 [Hyphomicrobiales bacterium]